MSIAGIVAGMTVAEMTSEVYSILGLPSTGTPDLPTSKVLRYLKEAHLYLAVRTKCYKRNYTFPVESGDKIFTLPDDFASFDYLKYGNYDLEATTISYLDANFSLWRNNTNGIPSFYYNYGINRVGIETPVDGTKVLMAGINCVPHTFATEAYFPLLEFETDTPTDIPSIYCMILVFSAVVRALGTSIGDTVDGVQLRMSYCLQEKERLTKEFIGSMVIW